MPLEGRSGYMANAISVAKADTKHSRTWKEVGHDTASCHGVCFKLAFVGLAVVAAYR